jgi:hypothetical protein
LEGGGGRRRRRNEENREEEEEEGEELGMNSVNQRCCCKRDRRLRRGNVEKEGERQGGKDPECVRRALTHTHTRGLV